MIKKLVHYCWFGGSIPENIENRISQWKSLLPDYEFILWNEENFDVYANDFTKQMYEKKKYAFVTDYVRLFAVYQMGGFYFDTDVLLVKSIDDLTNNAAVFALEDFDSIATGLGFGAEKKKKNIADLLNIYNSDDMQSKIENGQIPTCVEITSNYFREKGFVNKDFSQTVDECKILSTEYFSPIKVGSNRINITYKTHGIHLFEGSWSSDSKRLLRFKVFVRRFIVKLFGSSTYQYIKHFLKR